MSLSNYHSAELTPKSPEGLSEVFLPGSKSITNRALVLAALAEGQTILRGASLSDDSLFLIAALAELGVVINVNESVVTVQGRGGSFLPYRGTLDVGAGGTTIRFLLPLVALAEGAEVVVEGTERLNERPIGDLVGALNALGADIQYQGRVGTPPLFVRGSERFVGGKVSISGAVSSQFLSSLLMIGGALPNGLQLICQGEQVSKPYIEMTLALLKSFGVQVERDGYREFKIAAQSKIAAQDLDVEGDASAASYFWGIGAATGRPVRVRGLPENSCQGDAGFFSVLAQMGCSVTSGSDQLGSYIEVCGPKKLQAVDVNLEAMPDTAQTLAVLAALAEGPTVITGLGTLRHKETDRIAAVVTELGKTGILATQTQDSITVHGGVPHGAAIATYEDHRMAMSFAILGSVIPGIEILEPRVVTKSYPTFWEVLPSCGIAVRLNDQHTGIQ